MSKNIRQTTEEWSRNLWSRVKALFTGLDTRVTALEQSGGGGGGGDVNVIESITMNGDVVPPDANKNVALAESDPTVPAWAKSTTKPTYTVAEVGAKATQSPVTSPTARGTAVAFIDTISQDAQGVITPTKKTVPEASQSAAGLMSATDKTKLDGIAAGAQVNSVTGVKGSAESSYRTGNVNLTLANIGIEIGSIRNPGTVNNTALFGTFFAQGSACTGLPTSDSRYYAIAAFGVYQIAARYTNNGADCIFTRYYINNRWYPWTSSQMQGDWLPSGTSIDDVNTQGTYGLSSANTYTGLPSGVTNGILEVIAPVATSDIYVIQRLNAGGSNIYQRYRTLNNGTAYSNWYRYAGTAV